jgi:hypothetical protein
MNEHANLEQSPRAYTPGDNIVSPRRGASRAPVPSGSPQISTQHYPMLPVKSSRACNVVKFSSTYPNLLAVGLDKARNESCLMVWDVSQATSLDESRSPGAITLAMPGYRHKWLMPGKVMDQAYSMPMVSFLICFRMPCYDDRAGHI